MKFNTSKSSPIKPPRKEKIALVEVDTRRAWIDIKLGESRMEKSSWSAELRASNRIYRRKTSGLHFRVEACHIIPKMEGMELEIGDEILEINEHSIYLVSLETAR